MCFIFNWLQWNVFFKQNYIIHSGLVWIPGLLSGASLKTFKPNMSRLCAVLMVFWGFWMARFPFHFLSVHFRRSCVFWLCLLSSTQSCHTSAVTLCTWLKTDSTPVKSYSNLSVKHCKNGLLGKQQTDGVMAIPSGAHRCIQHSVTGIWCQHWGIFHEHL